MAADRRTVEAGVLTIDRLATEAPATPATSISIRWCSPTGLWPHPTTRYRDARSAINTPNRSTGRLEPKSPSEVDVEEVIHDEH